MIIFALLLRLIFICLVSPDIILGSDQYYYDKTAKGILAGEGYHSLNLLAYQPPLFACFIALIYSLFGSSIYYVLFAQAILGSISCLLIYWIAGELSGKDTGLLAAFIAAGYLQLIRYSSELLSETLFIFLILAAVLAVLISERRANNFMAVTAGVLFGLAALTREVALFPLLGIILWYYWISRDMVQALKKWSMVFLFAILTILPWTVRNYLVFHSLVPLSTSGGINFYIGNNPEATAEYRFVLPSGAIWNKPSPNGRTEIETARLCYREAIKFIRDHPKTFFLQTARRVYQLWGPPFYKVSITGSKSELAFRLIWLAQYLLIFILSFILVPFLFKKEIGAWTMPYLMILLLSAPYFFTLASSRFRLPLIPFMVILASGALIRLYRNHIY